MTDAAISFPRASVPTRDLLRQLLADRPEPCAAGVTVSTKVPYRADEEPVVPLVVIRQDGRFRDSVLNGRATVRVSVWHRDEGLGEDLVNLIEALLLSSHVPGIIRGYGSLTGPIPTSDPDTGNPLTYFTVSARLVPTNLSGDPA